MNEFATPADIKKFRELSTQELNAATFLLEYGSAKIRRRFKTIDARILSGDLDPVIPRGVLCRMVIDVLNNPDSYVTEQIEDAAYRFDPELLRKRMVPTDDEVGDLEPPVVGKRSLVRTIHVRPCL